MNLYDNIHFEGKHEDEKILHFCRPASMQLKYELFKLTFPIFCIAAIFIALYVFDIILSFFIIISILIALIVLSTFSIFYKIYRSKNNYLYITSKRVLFHGIEGFFKDYVKKINYENIRNINYFTESLIGRICKYGTLEIQSSHGGEGDIKVYHVQDGKMLTHYIDKLISLSSEERKNFHEFNPDYFKNWKS